MAEENVDVLDENGRFLYRALKSKAHTEGLLHKVVIGCLKYGDRWAFIKQAADRQDAHQLAMPVGGHVSSGESEVDALLRESEEEIGTREISYKRIGDAIFRRKIIGRDENHLFVIFELETKSPLTFGKEIVAMEKFTPSQLKKALEERSAEFGDAFYFIFSHFYPEYLPAGWKSKWR